MAFVAFLVLLTFLNSGSVVSGVGLIEVFKWKQIEFAVPNYQSPDFLFPEPLNHEDVPNMDYVPYNNVPMGVSHYKGILFVTLPRRRPGIPATLNYITTKYSSGIINPKFLGYPNYATNALHPSLAADSNRIISVYRTRVDYACDRLWFVDTGMLEYPNNRTQVQRPSIWVIDLKTNRRVRRFEIPESIVETGRGLPEITVDSDSSECYNSYAYLPDLVSRALYVYRKLREFREWHSSHGPGHVKKTIRYYFRSREHTDDVYKKQVNDGHFLNEDRIWRFDHNYFSFDPLWGDFNIADQRFQWDDGVFSITLGNKNPDGYRTAFFHAMCSTSEFFVSTKVLRNESNSQRSYHGTDFQLAGNRGPYSQSTMHDFDPQHGVIFFAEISKSGVTCWNTNKALIPENVGLIQKDDKTMIYPSDLTIDNEENVWVMTNSMPRFIYAQLNPMQYNFRIWKQNVHDAIQNTVCAA